MSNIKKPLALDLFCGCGGISAGLKAAGFEVIAGVDIERKFIVSFEKNFPTAKSLALDISALDPGELMNRVGIQPGELDLLAGGPPCQGFSKNVPRKHRYLEDTKNKLVKSFLDFCEALQPQMIIMENVAEMKNGFEQAYTDEILERLEKAGFKIAHNILMAADFGIPQRRRRAFFVANRVGFAFQFPRPTHGEKSTAEELFPRPSWVNVWDAIGDLPSIRHGEGEELCEYATTAFSDYQRLVRNPSNHVTNHTARHLRPTQHERLSSIQPGECYKHLPAHLKTKGGYSGAYGRLTKEMVAPTITRWVFHPGSGRWGHPVDIRTLTIREVARIQGFPDSFDFVGSFTQRAGQLGNAVPPLLLQRIAEELLVQRERCWSKASISLSKSSKLNLCAAVG
jgi:DNA (cytosine-5)-methyltransferase 1